MGMTMVAFTVLSGAHRVQERVRKEVAESQKPKPRLRFWK